GLMVSLWRKAHGTVINRISGLAYLNELLNRTDFQKTRSIVWVLPNRSAQSTAQAWLKEHGLAAEDENFYVAPIYGSRVEDEALVQIVRTLRPAHIIIALSGGVQEKLGFYLREKAVERAAIHCIGAALGFITGYQVRIPGWADRFYLGWLFRLIANPRRFLPRALDACALPGMIRKYGETLPPLESSGG
ncbi:MAG TPA: WecB/TagA/CpsF family glycosyltransferase, partial [Chthoniobacterales bacterium]